jgi:hypothetical protein
MIAIKRLENIEQQLRAEPPGPTDLRFLLDLVYELLSLVDDAARDRGQIPQDSLPSVQLLAEIKRLRGAIETHKKGMHLESAIGWSHDKVLWAVLEDKL